MMECTLCYNYYNYYTKFFAQTETEHFPLYICLLESEKVFQAFFLVTLEFVICACARFILIELNISGQTRLCMFECL